MAYKSLTLFGKKRSAVVALGVMLCAIVFASISAHAQSKVLGPISLQDDTRAVYLGPHTLIQQDPEGKITPQSIIDSGGAILSGKLFDQELIHLGYEGTPAWLAVKLVGNSARKGEWILDLGRRSEGRMGHLVSVQAYEMELTSPITIREIQSAYHDGVYRIKLAHGESKYLLLSVTPLAGKPAIVPMRILSEHAYADAIQLRSNFDVVYSVILAVFAAFFLALASSNRRMSYTIFGAYFFYAIFVWMASNVVSMQAGSDWHDELLLILALGFSIFSIFMTKIFWSIEQGSYTEKYILYGLVWLNIVSTGLCMLLPVGNGVAHIALYYGAPGVTFVFICLMSLAQSRTISLRKNLYPLSWLFPITGLAVTVLAACKFLPENSFLLNGFWYALMGQGLFLIPALYRRFAEMSERDLSTNGFEPLNYSRLREAKESADNTRLLKVIQNEREMLAEFRTKEAIRTEEMRLAKEAADEANREKSAFLAVVSHEIRTPMTGVMGMVKLLLDSNITKQQRDYVLTIQESSEAMLALLNDILDFEKIQRGKMELENISFDLQRLVQGVYTLMSGHAAEKEIRLEIRMDLDIPRFVKGDPTRLRQILLNLMGNAIKFTESGTVTLFVNNLNAPTMDDMPRLPGNKGMIYFAVQDSGIGIPLEHQRKLFNPFSQANSSVARKFGGSGLGLAISKGLVEMMGSSINIKSQDGEGSTFFFTLEMERGQPTMPAQSAPLDLSARPDRVDPMSILVVDDNAITRKVLVSFLEASGHSVSTSSTAEEGLRRVEQGRFDLIFMDIELPGMSGNEATKILRAHQDPARAKTPVIAITGNVDKEDTDRYLADGMTMVLAKPIESEKLNDAIREVAKNRSPDAVKIPAARKDIFADIDPNDNFDSFAAAHAAQKQPGGSSDVFNPGMLHSLKDTIGQKQLSDLLDDLIVKIDEILAQIDEAEKAGDLLALAARTHELKGMTGNFGLVEISEIAAQAERKAKTQETNGLSELLGALPDASARAQTALKDWAAH